MKAQVDAAHAALAELEKADFKRRLLRKDATLWKPDAPAHQDIIRGALGWIGLPDAMAPSLSPIRLFALELARAGVERVVVLGMGGSSLCCRVFRDCFGPQAGAPRLEVLDSTHPSDVNALAAGLDYAKTAFIVASKSGSTIEPNCMFEHFWERAGGAAGARPKSRFIAITDPGTSLEKLARGLRFSNVFINPPDIGGRFSALSNFGLVPAAAAGLDVGALLSKTGLGDGAASTIEEGLRLGAFIGGHAREGRDKLTVLLSPRLKPFGAWIEQLVAESTGKDGLGVLPVIEDEDAPASCFGSDRAVVALTLMGDNEEGVSALVSELQESQPVARLRLGSLSELGRQFYVWEIATAAAGFLLGVDPFDQPDVQSAKDRTMAMLREVEKGKLPAEKSSFQAGSMAAFADKRLCRALEADGGVHLPLKEALAAHLRRAKKGDFVSVLAYAQESEENVRLLQGLKRRLRGMLPKTVPVTLSFGPRYLHSTGQLHKGGPKNGLFLELLETDVPEAPIPQRRYGFKVLHQAQARGDFAALLEAGRRALRIDLGLKGSRGLNAVHNAAA